MYASAKQTYALLTNLLTWSRLERGLMEYVPQQILLADLIDRQVLILASNAQQKQITVKNVVEKKYSRVC